MKHYVGWNNGLVRISMAINASDRRSGSIPRKFLSRGEPVTMGLAGESVSRMNALLRMNKSASYARQTLIITRSHFHECWLRCADVVCRAGRARRDNDLSSHEDTLRTAYRNSR